jgi:hypothetical protein
MLSEKQLLANRQNALKSTGPRSAAGRAMASQNALRHGLRSQRTLIAGEDPNEFQQFRQLMLDDLAPVGALELMLADRIVAGFWKLQRAGGMEAEILDDLRHQLHQQHIQQQIPEGGPFFGQTIPEDFPYKNAFQRCPRAKADWDTTPDGVAFAEGKMDAQSAENTFVAFAKQHEEGWKLPDDDVDLPAMIEKIKNQYKDNPQWYECWQNLETEVRKLARIPVSRESIPGMRKYIQGIMELEMNSRRKNPELIEMGTFAIAELNDIQKSVENRLRPDLGQTVSSDFTGSNVLARFQRYEGHIERALYKALTELQKLQILRSGRWMPNPPDEQTQVPTLDA